jgi:hypothetical protein
MRGANAAAAKPEEGTSAASASSGDAAAPVSVQRNSIENYCHYDVKLPKTAEGFMVRIGASQFLGYHATFSSYRQHSTGEKSFAETHNLLRNVGDVFIAVDGFDMLGKSFDEVVQFIGERSRFQDSVIVRMLDKAAFEVIKANEGDATTGRPKDTLDVSDARKRHDVDDVAKLILPAVADDSEFTLNKEDEVILQKAIDEDGDEGLKGTQNNEIPSSDNKNSTPRSATRRAVSGSKNDCYDVFLPMTPDGFMFLLNPVSGGRNGGYTTSFHGYHRHPDGRLSVAEKKQVFRRIGDIVVAIDGVDVKGKSPAEVFRLLKNLKGTRTSVSLRLIETSSPPDQQKSDIRSEKVAAPYSSRTSTGSSKSQKPIQSKPTPEYGNTMVECIAAPEPELAGLGWMRKGYKRQSNPSHIDRYWFTPKTQKKLRSRVEVTKFLEHLKNAGDDEDEAYDLLKGRISKERTGRRSDQTKEKVLSGKKNNLSQISARGQKDTNDSRGNGDEKESEPTMEQTVREDFSNKKIAADGTNEEEIPLSSEGQIPGENSIPTQMQVSTASEDEGRCSDLNLNTSSYTIIDKAAPVSNMNTEVGEEGVSLQGRPTRKRNGGRKPASIAEKEVNETEEVVKEAGTVDINKSSDYGATSSFISMDLENEAAIESNINNKMFTRPLAKEQSDGGKKHVLLESEVDKPEDVVERASEISVSGHETSVSGVASSFISIDLENLTSRAAGSNLSIPVVTAEPLSICSQRELKNMPVAFAFELEDRESEHNAKAAQLLWYSSLLNDNQRQSYVKHHVLHGARRKRNAESKSPSTAAKPRKTSKRKKLKKETKSPFSSPGNAQLIESITAPEPELAGLGWTRKSFQRNTNKKHIDRYWFTPKIGVRLRSRPECIRFLKCLEKADGDEGKAYASFMAQK